VRGFLNRDDIAILLIVQYVAEMVRHIIDNYTKLTPAILEIPSKEHAYDPAKDFILKRAQVINILSIFLDLIIKLTIFF
jgi:V-type H+-transporting ATPase subunit F